MGLFDVPAAPTPPPPPPAAPLAASPSIAENNKAQKETLATAEGEGLNGTDVTGGQGVKAPATTKSLLGGD